MFVRLYASNCNGFYDKLRIPRCWTNFEHYFIDRYARKEGNGSRIGNDIIAVKIGRVRPEIEPDRIGPAACARDVTNYNYSFSTITIPDGTFDICRSTVLTQFFFFFFPAHNNEIVL